MLYLLQVRCGTTQTGALNFHEIFEKYMDKLDRARECGLNGMQHAVDFRFGLDKSI